MSTVLEFKTPEARDEAVAILRRLRTRKNRYYAPGKGHYREGVRFLVMITSLLNTAMQIRMLMADEIVRCETDVWIGVEIFDRAPNDDQDELDYFFFLALEDHHERQREAA